MGEPDDGEGDPDDGLGEPLEGLGDPLDGGAELGDWELGGGDSLCEGGGLWELGGGDVGTGGGGCWGGEFWKRSTAINRARAAIRIINSQLTSIVIHPARSWRPGQGSGHRRDVPGAVFSIQCRR